MDDAEFLDLVARARGGDPSAVEAILRHFEADVRLMVRTRLPRLLRGQLDSLDVAQDIWASLLADPDARQDLDFATPGRFRQYLAGAVQHKVLEQYRRRTRVKKYDLTREEPLEVRRGPGPGARGRQRELPAPDPSPSQEVQAEDRMAQLTAGRSPAERLALELRRDGLTFAEIAERTGMHERTVRNLIADLRGHMEARQWR
jgi:RNA polymerase sigma-70 factor (ECF subfamily)